MMLYHTVILSVSIVLWTCATNITHTNITHTNLTHSNFTHSNFTYSNFTHSNFTQVNITYNTAVYNSTHNITVERNDTGIAVQYFKDPENQDELVDELIRNYYITSKIVEEVMRKVDREVFVPFSPLHSDCQNIIGYNAFASPPNVHARALEALKDHLKNGSRALDVGSGSGYMTVSMAEMMRYDVNGSNNGSGFVTAIEHVPQLMEYTRQNVKIHDFTLLQNDTVKVVLGDGQFGVPDRAPYDAIYVGASVKEIPKPLLRQLKLGGRMVIPIGHPKMNTYITIVDKDYRGKVKVNRTDTIEIQRLTSLTRQCRRTTLPPESFR